MQPITINVRTILKILFFYCFCANLCAQENLILNPSFETLTSCNPLLLHDNQIANWYATSGGLGQHLPGAGDSCGNLVGNGFPIDSLARTGKREGHLHTYGLVIHDTVFRTYLYTPLKKTLTKGKVYYFEMYMRLEDNPAVLLSDYATNNQTARFTNQCFCIKSNFGGGLAVGGDIDIKNDGDVILNKWTKISGCFTSKEDEKFLTIGNFDKDSNTKKQKLPVPIDVSDAFYRVDDVSLYELDIHLPNDTTICSGDSIYIDPKLQYFKAAYEWNDGITKPERYFKDVGIYKLKVTPDGLCPTFETQMEIKYLPNRAEWIARDTNLCRGDTLTLTAARDTTDTKFSWSDNSTKPEIKIAKTGLYWVNLKNKCTSHTDTINVRPYDCHVKAYVPNAFSPNGDGVNDVFQPFISSIEPITTYKFDVFDKWGNHVYLSENINDKWDGKYHDHDCPTGAYIWQLQFTVNQAGVEVPYEYSGEVVIVK